jgi:hypothetical protein
VLFQPLAAFYGKPMARRALEDAISERIRKDFERRGKKCLATTDRVLISPPRPPKRLDLQGTYVLSGHPSDSHSRVMPFEEITGPVSESMYRQDIAGQLALLFLPPEAEVPERLLLRALHEALSAMQLNHLPSPLKHTQLAPSPTIGRQQRRRKTALVYPVVLSFGTAFNEAVPFL